MLAHFHKRWRELPLVVIDTETTGVVPGVDDVVQLGIARFPSDRELLPSVGSWLVNPGRPIPPEATAIHGITDDMVRDAPTLVEVLAHARELLKDAQPCAYNAPSTGRCCRPRHSIATGRGSTRSPSCA
jgi:DNA polymerase-3 subunit epsilon